MSMRCASNASTWRTCLLAALVAFVRCAGANDIPALPDPGKTYLIYLHGRIVEGDDSRPIDNRFGLYDYPAIVRALGARGAVVISAQRKQNTDVNEYAGFVVAQIERLIHAGVPAKQVVVVGFSKGGAIAVHVSSFLRRPDVRYALLAACWPRPDEPQLRLTGRVLAIREASDTLAGESCRPLAEQAERPQAFEELQIATGYSHGAFYLPRREWLDPLLDWVHGAPTPAATGAPTSP
jgi:hypothetical protein